MVDVTALQLEHRAPQPPPDRGRMLTAQQVADRIGGGVSESWVRQNVPHKLILGHRTVRWFEGDVLGWLELRRSL